MNRQAVHSVLLAALLLACAPAPAEAAICGNGRINQGEGCDDGNNAAGDGCGANCLTELGWRCTREDPSVCTNVDVCGNGQVEAGEDCDDANLTQGDGCYHDCTVEEGHTCTGEPSVCVPPGNLPVGVCGDGVVDDDEECDDADTTTADGCDGDCQVEAGFECTGEPSVCTESDCGNGTIDAGEDCDGGPCCEDCLFATPATTCRSGAGGCDGAERCSGTSAECPADTPATDACVTVCREPRFWATRATAGGDRHAVIDLVLDQTGTIEVCGQSIDNADDLGELDAALEGLCVATRGVEERDLYRALVTTALNCLVSDGGDDCDSVLSRFVDVSLSECDALCQGNGASGATVEECVEQLECFNSGGQLVDGQCATGTCESDPGRLCGGDFGACNGDDGSRSSSANAPGGAEVDDDGDECVGFEGNCADARLCQPSTAEARLCGRKLVPRNSKVCRDARSNQCTIDDCD